VDKILNGSDLIKLLENHPEKTVWVPDWVDGYFQDVPVIGLIIEGDKVIFDVDVTTKKNMK